MNSPLHCELIIPGNTHQTIEFAAKLWISQAIESIQKKGRFAVALSGGSTPKAIYQKLAELSEIENVDWSKVWLFWSDERAVPPDDPASNYQMAMAAGFSRLPISASQIFRMVAEVDITNNAKKYEQLIEHYLGASRFDLVMLGVGEDGHTASLFPNTAALQVKHHLVAANYVPAHNSWRMTLTFPCIQQSQHVVVYALGKLKQKIAKEVFELPPSVDFPVSLLGTPQKKILWILDNDAAQLLESRR